jgi:hypothetical protein
MTSLVARVSACLGLVGILVFIVWVPVARADDIIPRVTYRYCDGYGGCVSCCETIPETNEVFCEEICPTYTDGCSTGWYGPWSKQYLSNILWCDSGGCHYFLYTTNFYLYNAC